MTLEFKPLPPQEAIAFWRNKVPMAPKEFNTLAAEAKLRAFAVSGIAKGAELETVYAAMQRAIEQGTTFEQFKQECGPIFERRGWTGKRSWRVDNIFRTNVQTAYHVGRYKQLRQATATRPYWMYDAVNDRRTRPTHRALNGQVYPADHPFWDTWYPPNGFRCRCGVTSLSARQVERMGVTVAREVPELIEPIDPVTGNRMPAVQLLPDPGFAYNPGKSYWEGVTPGAAEGEVLPLVGKAICGKPGDYAEERCRPSLAEIDPRHVRPFTDKDLLPSGLAPEAYVKAFLQEFGIEDLSGEKLITLPGESGRVLPVNKGLFVDKGSGRWKVVTRDGRERYVKLLAQTIRDPYEAWLVPAEVSGRVYTVINLIRLFGDAAGKVGGFVVWSLVGDRWLTATAFPPKLGGSEQQLLEYLEGQRVGRLLYREAL
jgi:SPP1 gp7 family putative phage head morphogenesis protein